MKKMRKLINASLQIAGLMLLVSSTAMAQKLPKRIYIQAQAMGQSTQLGQSFNITVSIEEYSTPDDQKALLGAFSEKKNEGLVNALSKMKTKGRLSITGTLGYDVSYIRSFAQPDGTTKIRLVTNRPITFGEAWSDSRSSDYNLSALEIILSPNKKKNSGTLAPACQFKMDKQNQIELELLQNEWKLVNIQQR
jgi:hypothetical protein